MIQNSNVNNATKETEEESFDVKAFIGKLIGGWWIILLSFVVCGILAALFMYYKAPAYNITSTVLIDDGDSNASSIASSSSSLLDISSLLDLKNNVDNETQVLLTHHLLEKTVRDMKLNIIYYQQRFGFGFLDAQTNRNPFIVSILKEVDTIQTTKFFFSIVDSNTFHLYYKVTNPDLSTQRLQGNFTYNKPFYVIGVGLLNIKKNPEFGFGDSDWHFDIESVDQRIYDLQQILTIATTSTTTSTINLVIDYPIPREGENILGTLIKNYQVQNLRLKNEVADSTIKFIDGRLKVVGKQLEDIETNVQDFKQKNSLLGDLSEQGKLLVDNTAAYNDQMAKNAIVLSVSKALLTYLNDTNHNQTVVPNAIIPDDVILASLINQYNTLIGERDKQSLSVTNENPFMKNLEDRIVTLRKDMIKYLVNTERSLQITDQHLKVSTNQFNNQITKVPPMEKIYLDLQRQQAIWQTIYTYLLQTKEETEISKTSNLSIATLIDPPKADYKPYSPSIVIVGAAAFFLAIFFPVARVFAKDLLNSKILVREDITKNTNIPISALSSPNKDPSISRNLETFSLNNLQLSTISSSNVNDNI